MFCASCEGIGTVIHGASTAPFGRYVEVEVTCEDCEGTGRRCRDCGDPIDLRATAVAELCPECTNGRLEAIALAADATEAM